MQQMLDWNNCPTITKTTFNSPSTMPRARQAVVSWRHSFNPIVQNKTASYSSGKMQCCVGAHSHMFVNIQYMINYCVCTSAVLNGSHISETTRHYLLLHVCCILISSYNYHTRLAYTRLIQSTVHGQVCIVTTMKALSCLWRQVSEMH